MARRRLPRALATSVANYILDPGEIVYEQTNDTTRLGDGSTEGGNVLAKSTDLYLNVKDFPFFAKGDNSTNDSAAIQAADTVATASGRTLFFPKGVYRTGVSQISRGGCPWQGDGPQTSIIRAVATTFTNLTGLVSCQNKEGCHTRDMGFDLSPGIFPAGVGNPGNIFWAISFQLCTDWDLTNCEFKGIGAQRIGLAVDGGSRFNIIKNRFKATASPSYNQACNISFAAGLPTGYYFCDNVLEGSGFLTNGANGIVSRNDVSDWQFGGGLTFGPNVGCANHTVEGNRCVGGSGTDINAVHPSGIEIWSPFSKISNNWCESNAGEGIGGGGFAMRGEGNTCLNNGQESGGGVTLNSITIGGTDYDSSQSVWTDNTLCDTQGSPTQLYGYAEYIVGGPAMSQIDVHENKVFGNATGSYLFTSGQRSFRGPRLVTTVAGTIGTLAAGVSASQSVTIAGARMGDLAAVSFSDAVTGFSFSANCDADNNVVIRVQNVTAGSLAFPAGNWSVAVEKTPNSAGY